MGREGQTHFDAIVVGGGFSGVVAARDLSTAGFDVALIEARDRLGGRTWAKDSALGRRLELGGAYVHWTQPHVFAEISALGLELSPSGFPEIAFWKVDGELRQGPFWEFLSLSGPLGDTLEAEAREAFPNPYDILPLTPAAVAADERSIADVVATLDTTPDQREAISAMWSMSVSGALEDASYAHALRFLAVGGSSALFAEASSGWSIAGGTGALLNGIHGGSSATTILSTEITSIVQDGDTVTLTTAGGGVYTASQVIVTAPFAALAQIDFQPPLTPGKRALVDAGQGARGFKVWMRVKGTFESFIAWAPQGNALSMLVKEYEVDGDTILLAFGNDAGDLDLTDAKAVEAATRIWRDDIEVIAVDAHDWTGDPLSGETWAILRPGQLQHLDELRAPEGRVRLAGAATARGWAGYIDGAVESGRDAAREAVAALRERA